MRFLGNFNEVEARLIVSVFHEGLIYMAMFVIIWHTSRINKHTIKMIAELENEQKMM